MSTYAIDADTLRAIDDLYESHVDFEACHRPDLGSYTTEAWYRSRQRREIVSASRLADVLGFGFKSVSAAFRERVLEIRSEAPPQVDNHHMYRGRLAEPVLLDYLRAILKKVDPGWRVIGNEDQFANAARYPFLSATPDGFIISPRGNVYVLEMKCPERLKMDEHGIPLCYAPQVVCQMVCTGARGAFFFQCSPEDGYRLYFMIHNELTDFFIEDVMKPACLEFVRRLETNEEPPRFNGRAVFQRQSARLFTDMVRPCGFVLQRMFEILPLLDSDGHIILHHTDLAPLEVARHNSPLKWARLRDSEVDDVKSNILRFCWFNK